MRAYICTIVSVLLTVALLLGGCKKESDSGGPTGPETPPPLGGSPTIVSKTAVNDGQDLRIIWSSVENAKGYKIYCDGNEIRRIIDTTYTIPGASHVCQRVEVYAYNEGDEKRVSIDLTPVSASISGLVSHDGISGYSWVKMDFSAGDVVLVPQSSVDITAPNTGWFVFYNNYSYGTPEFRDASATSVGQARMELAFTPNTSGSLAPGIGNYRVVRQVASGGFYFFWADNTSTGYGSMDNNDYFGVVRVLSIDGSGPYTADLEVYMQLNVPGLRWVPGVAASSKGGEL